VIVDSEAEFWLQSNGFDNATIPLILNTWRAEIVPVFRKLNIGSITEAYVFGVLARPEAKAKLLSIGLEDGDADLELTLAEKRNPEAFGQGLPPPAKILTPGVLSELLVVGLITAQVMTDRLVAQHYTLRMPPLTQAAQLALQPFVRRLPQWHRTGRYCWPHHGCAGLQPSKPGLQSRKCALDCNHRAEENPPEPPEPEPAKQLGLNNLEELLIGGWITAVQMTDRLIALNYTHEGAAARAGRRLRLHLIPPLSQSSIERAVLVALITDAQAVANPKLGFTHNTLLMIETLHAEFPPVVPPPPAEPGRHTDRWRVGRFTHWGTHHG
jgi:hypothetical protein